MEVVTFRAEAEQSQPTGFYIWTKFSSRYKNLPVGTAQVIFVTKIT